jgi:hypothetical protein
MTDRLREGEREQLVAALSGWGMPVDDIADTLEGCASTFGLVELKPDAEKKHPEVAIVVDDRNDEELRGLFAWRADTSDDDYLDQWRVEQPPLLRVVLGADDQALVRFGFTILKPDRVERRFLLSVNAEVKLLTIMQLRGCRIWLAAASLIQREAARGGPSDVYDLRERCLVVGRVDEPIESLDEALAHVGSPRPVATDTP